MDEKLRLPDELIVRILENLKPQDLRTCQLVCRYFCTLINNSLPTRFILTLDSLGYTMPSVPRLDLTLDRKLELLEQHRKNWSFPPKSQPIELTLGVNSLTQYEYVGGVYACSIESTLQPPTRGLHFYQLPSPNLGLEFRDWCIPDLGLNAWGFTIEPDQNLLVLLDIYSPSPGRYHGFQIHLRTMDTNEPHPRAINPFLLAELGHWQVNGEMSDTNEMDALPYKGFSFEVSEGLLAVLFRSRPDKSLSWVIVWDWIRGVEVTRVSTTYTHAGPDLELSFTLLSQDTLLLPRFSNSYYGIAHRPNVTFGSLDVYTFNPHCVTSAPPRMIASYCLPNLEGTDVVSTVKVNRLGSRSPRGGRPQVYEPSSHDRFVSFNVRLDPLYDGVGSPWTQMLYAPIHILLNSQGHTGNTCDSCNEPSADPGPNFIPWRLWGHHVLRAGANTAQPVPRGGFDGQRAAMVLFSFTDNTVNRSVLVHDFSQKRRKWVESGMGETAGEICGSGADVHMIPSPVGALRLLGEAAFNGDEGASPRLKYIKNTLEVGDKSVWRAFVDDEHLVLQGERNGLLALEVYTF